jgi:hypothetical protein
MLWPHNVSVVLELCRLYETYTEAVSWGRTG